MKVYECDRCKTLIRNNEPSELEYLPEPLYSGDHPERQVKQLCSDCLSSFHRWMKNATPLK